MTLRLVATPLASLVPAPAVRTGALHSGLVEAWLRAPGTETAIRSLADPGVLVVTTGQQPALFTGPLYTIHKALSAAALAEVLGRRWDRKVVPVFWVAGDDHDFTEANHASWLNADGALVTAVLRERPPDAPLLPLYREPLGPEVDGVLAQLEADLPPAEHREGTLDWLRRHFRPDKTVAGAYGSALAELLAPFGIVCLDSTHAAVKKAAGPLLVDALRKAADIERLLDERSGDLVGQGTDPGVAAADGATLVMVEAALGRDRLVRTDGGFVTRRAHQPFGFADLERLAQRLFDARDDVGAVRGFPHGRGRRREEFVDALGRRGLDIRAVGSAIARNPVAYLIPCHRVIRKTGAFGGYHWGTARKVAMLLRETAPAVERAGANVTLAAS